MGVHHIDGHKGDVAPRVLLPGDPLRAKYIAENFLEDAKLYTSYRNMLGYTGSYKGVPVSVQGTGMGIPSISIYLHDLIERMGCTKLIRVGTCGAMSHDVNLRDVIIAQGASTDSSIIRNIFRGTISYAPIADYSLLEKAVNNARKLNLPVKVGNVISVDRFYDEEIDNDQLMKYGIIAVEMEAAALYTLAAKYKVQGLAILTVSDHLLTNAYCSVEERETSFDNMIRIALETIIED